MLINVFSFIIVILINKIIFQSQLEMQASEKKAFCALWGTFSALAGYGSILQYLKYKTSSEKWNKINTDISSFNPITIRGQDLISYPWYGSGDVKDWEYKLVKLKGYFREERFFVAREKDGKPGFLVFAPFMTALHELDTIRKHDVNTPVETGIFVNLGWVPSENKDDIEMTSEPVPFLEPDDSEFSVEDPNTGYATNSEHLIERNIYPLTEITGIVRAGESESLFGKKNWKYEGVYNWIDLPGMATFFNMFNYDSASTAYIERTVPELEEGEANYPIPSTKDSFFRSESPSDYQKNSNYLAGVSILGLGISLFHRFKL